MPIKYWKKTDYLAGSSPLRRQILIVIHGSPARHPARQGTAAQGAWPIAHSSGGEHQQCLHPMGTVVDASLHKRNSSDIPSAPTSGVGGYRRNSFWWGLNTHGSICVYRHRHKCVYAWQKAAGSSNAARHQTQQPTRNPVA